MSSSTPGLREGGDGGLKRDDDDASPSSLPPHPSPLLVLLAVGAVGVSCVMTQLALMRELLAAFGGNELVFGVVLGNWLLLLGIGTWLGRAADRLRNPVTVFVFLQLLVALLPPAQVVLLRALRNVVFIRGAAVGMTETVTSTFVLLLPYGVAAGAALTLACSLLARRDGATGIGRVYVADSVGSIAGGVLFSFVVVWILDHASLLIIPAVLNLLAAGALAARIGHRWLTATALTLAAAVVALAVTVNLDGVSTAWQFPGQHIVARENSPYGRLLVTETDGQFDFFENSLPLTSTRDDQHVEETVHYAMAQRPEARTVLLVAGGISGTAREILKHPVRRVDYVELDPAILKIGREFLPQNLADERIRILNTDGRRHVRRSGERYDVVLIDVPTPSTAQLNRFFTVEFFAEVKRMLAADGVVCFPLGRYGNYVSPELARLLASANRSLKSLFANTEVIPGGQVFFLASDGPLFSDIAARLEQQGIQTRLMNRHYLGAMLTPDRVADLRRAVAQPAALNTDFSPVLYFYHLRHWASQFPTSLGMFQLLLLALPCLYLVRLRGAALVLFASGFAGTALEIILLLAFQILCGSVYHQAGILVTVFMAGLALGALLANRPRDARAMPLRGRTEPQLPGDPAEADRRKRLAQLAFAIAALALSLPYLLPRLNQAVSPAASDGFIQATVALLTLILAVLVGMQFPLANRLEYDGTATGASRLYTADFIGACLGALLASTLLIPLVGVTGVCLLTAALNLAAGISCHFRKAIP